jgi:hypothetical protein
MLRYLTERLPVMVTPRWVHNRIQPIAIRDVLRYLVEWAAVPDEVHRSFDIGGPDVLTYREMMHRYARIAGLPHRLILPVWPLTPKLSSLWVGLITPVPSRIARPLVESLTHEAVVHEHDIARYVPDPPTGLTGFDAAVRLALATVRGARVGGSAPAWTGPPAEPIPTDPAWTGGSSYADIRRREVAAPVGALWSAIEGAGGAPRRRWRVEQTEPGRLLRLRATMVLPGRAWLEMRAVPHGTASRYEQRALFVPKGLAGHLYWRATAPPRALVFNGMADGIARAAERLSRRGSPARS